MEAAFNGFILFNVIGLISYLTAVLMLITLVILGGYYVLRISGSWFDSAELDAKAFKLVSQVGVVLAILIGCMFICLLGGYCLASQNSWLWTDRGI